MTPAERRRLLILRANLRAGLPLDQITRARVAWPPAGTNAWVEDIYRAIEALDQENTNDN